MDIDAVLAKYQTQVRPLCEAFAERLHALLAQIVPSHGVAVAQIEYRAKDPDSLRRKIELKQYGDPLSEITDLAGVRVITYYDDHVPLVADLLRQEFRVDAAHSLDKTKELDVDEFGYRSVHLVISIQKPRSTLAEWRPYTGIKAEIQIRSVLQHAWAAISHKLDYKSVRQAPQELRRQLFRLSALLELADIQFTDLRKQADGISQRYGQEVERGDLEMPLNVDSLSEYVKRRFDPDEWKALGIAAGMPEYKRTLLDTYLDTATKALLVAAQAAGASTIAELDALLKRIKPEAPARLKEFVTALKETRYGFYALGLDVAVMTLLLCRQQQGTPTSELDLPFRPQMLQAVDTVRKQKAIGQN